MVAKTPTAQPGRISWNTDQVRCNCYQDNCKDPDAIQGYKADPWVVRKAKSFFVLQVNIYCIHIQSILHISIIRQLKDIVHRFAKHSGNLDRQDQGRNISFLLKGDDRLPGAAA